MSPVPTLSYIPVLPDHLCCRDTGRQDVLTLTCLCKQLLLSLPSHRSFDKRTDLFRQVPVRISSIIFLTRELIRILYTDVDRIVICIHLLYINYAD